MCFRLEPTCDLFEDVSNVSEVGSSIEKMTMEQASTMVKRLGPKNAFMATVGPNDVIFIPSGFIIAERTLTSAAYGLRRFWFQGSDRTYLLDADVIKNKKRSKTVGVVCETVKKVLDKRG